MLRNAPAEWETKMIAPSAVREVMAKHVAERHAVMMARLPPKAKLSVAIDCWTSPYHYSFLAITGYVSVHLSPREILMSLGISSI